MRDPVGNEIKQNDLVAVYLQQPLLKGRVVEVAEGGLVTGLRQGGTGIRPSRVVIMCDITIEADPRGLVGSVLCLREDNAPSPAAEEPSKLVELSN